MYELYDGKCNQLNNGITSIIKNVEMRQKQRKTYCFNRTGKSLLVTVLLLLTLSDRYEISCEQHLWQYRTQKGDSWNFIDRHGIWSLCKKFACTSLQNKCKCSLLTFFSRSIVIDKIFQFTWVWNFCDSVLLLKCEMSSKILMCSEVTGSWQCYSHQWINLFMSLQWICVRRWGPIMRSLCSLSNLFSAINFHHAISANRRLNPLEIISQNKHLL